MIRDARDAVGERARDRGDDHRHRRPREDAQPGAERRVALHGLEELGEQEDRAEHPEAHQHRPDVRERERAVAEEAHRQHRVLGAQLPRDERRDEGEADDERSDDLGRGPADRVAADERPDDPEEARADEPDAGQVDAAERALRLVEPQQCERQEHEAERNVQPEDPVPGDAVHDGAADERPERDREAADAAPGAEEDAAALGRARRPRGSSASAAARSRRRGPARRARRRARRSTARAPQRRRQP